MKNLYFLVFSIIFTTNIYGQEELWDVVTLSGVPYSKVLLFKLENDTLWVRAYGNSSSIPIDSIKYLRREKQSHTGLGIVFGVIAGGIIGNEISKKRHNNNAPFSELAEPFEIMWGTGIGIIFGGVIGAVVGTGLGNDEFYSFPSYNKQKKNILLTKLIKRK
jgi:hypothetical protein